jgi:hypothetical protein
MERYECHFDNITNYPFESYHNMWKYLVTNGPKIHIQLL